MFSSSSHLPDLISSPDDLKSLVGLLSSQAVIAVDTESNSLFAYQERVCLIQFSTQSEDFLVDPLALEDLSLLGPVFANREIEKVFHAAEYDLLCLKRDFDFRFANLFDTMWAARILGWKEIGLGAVLNQEFGVRLEKRFQRANWGQRPLSAEQLNYARRDTHYLILLRNRLLKELEQTRRLELAREDFLRLERINEREPSTNGPVGCIERINGTRDLSPQQMAVLQALCNYREQMARKMDRPVFKVIGDKSLVSIAAACPVSVGELESRRMVSPRQAQLFGDGLVRAVLGGLKAPPIKPEYSAHRPDNGFLTRLEAVRSWRKETAHRMGVESDVVLPRDLMLEVVQKDPRNLEELRQILADVPWRAERFAGSLYTVLCNAY